MNRFCGQCGKELSSGNTFCGECGTPVDVVASSQVAPRTKVQDVTLGFGKRFALLVVSVFVVAPIVGDLVGLLFGTSVGAMADLGTVGAVIYFTIHRIYLVDCPNCNVPTIIKIVKLVFRETPVHNKPTGRGEWCKKMIQANLEDDTVRVV